MKKELAIFAAFILAVGMINGVSAHKSQIVGNYEVEVGWESEPPIVGKENAITFMITHASEDENAHDDEEAHDETDHNEAEPMSMEEEHEMVLEVHSQMMDEHEMALTGTMNEADVEEMLQRHTAIMEEHEEIMEEHESMKDQMSKDEWDKMMESHEKIRHDHDLVMQEHEDIMKLYDIDAEAEHEEHDESMSHDEMEHEDHGEGITGLASTLEADVTLNGEKTILELVEDEDSPGLYIGEYTPNEAGHPVVHLVGTLDDEVFEIDFHIEEVEDHITMTPIQQQREGIAPNEVECSEEKILLSKVSDGSAICVTPHTADLLIARSWATYF